MARQALRKEREVLGYLAKTILKNQVPAVLGWEVGPEISALTLEYLERKRVSSKVMAAGVVDFLSSMARLEAQTMSLKRFLAEVSHIHQKSYAEDDGLVCDALEWLESCSRAGREICLHLSHGDFAPWNCMWTERGFFVFDWEESRQAEVALADAFSYATSPAVHVAGRHNPERVFGRALDLGRYIARKTGWREDEVIVHYALWIFPRLGRHTLYRKQLRMVLHRFQ